VSQPFELQIALRYLTARRKQAFISIISLVSTIGVALGVTALILALALMTGLQQELRTRILGATAHIFVSKAGDYPDYHADADAMKKIPGVVGAAPAILGKALVSSARGEAFITLKGVDPALEVTVTDITASMRQGRFDSLAAPPADGTPPGLIVGEDLARQLEVKVGDDVTLVTPQGTLSPMGVMPRSRRLRIAGIFRLGLYEFDATYGFVSLATARRLTGEADVKYLQVRVDDIYKAPAIAKRIESTLGPMYLSQTWTELNKALFSALALEKLAISVTIGLIVMVAALNIVASLILLVMEKSRDIAILKTMGASSRSITFVFMLQGLLIGLVGTATGTALGCGLSWVADRYQLIRVPIDVYQIAYVPFVVLAVDLVTVMLTAVVICFVATIYPARQAAKLDPVEALRFG
jgi:lipoprotein-releasing system permease protein